MIMRVLHAMKREVVVGAGLSFKGAYGLSLMDYFSKKQMKKQ
jgi:hypothetical protein